jgi:senataxin
MDGSLYVPKVVRIGADSAIDIAVKDVFIDQLVERATSGNKSTTGTNDAQSRMQNMRNEIDSLRSDRDAKKVEMDSITNNEYRRGELNIELRKIKARIFELSQMLDTEKDKAQQSRRTMDAEQRKMRLKILSEADVICSTLSGAGHDYMSQLPFDFETVIIDEAAQSIELSSLIPLKYGCMRCILVGGAWRLPFLASHGSALTRLPCQQTRSSSRRRLSRASLPGAATTARFLSASCSEVRRPSTSSRSSTACTRTSRPSPLPPSTSLA